MSPKSFLLTEQLHQYIVDHSLPLDDVQRSLIAATEALGNVSGMQVAPEQGAFLTLLTAALGAYDDRLSLVGSRGGGLGARAKFGLLGGVALLAAG